MAGSLLPLGLGLLVGTYGSMIGAGGGFVLLPALLLLFPDDSPRVLTSMALAVVAINALSGTIAYLRARRIDFAVGVLLAAGATRFVPRG